MTLLQNLNSIDKWNEYVEYKESKALPQNEIKALKRYVSEGKYKKIAPLIIESKYTFDYPRKVLISKMGKKKKRTVYIYGDEELYILKMLSYILYEYDYLFSPNCYAFRKDMSVKTAVKRLTSHRKINDMYGYKLDIQDYFNSINIEKLLKILNDKLNDKQLIGLIEQLLINKKVYFNNEVIEESKGVMAGVPIASFLANIYLSEMDKYFYENRIVYARYSDDIILFANSKDELKKYIEKIDSFFDFYDLKKNEDKEYYVKPSTKWEFLGFSYFNGIIDISDNAQNKIKGKIRRSARAVRRWMMRKDVPEDVALKFMNKKFNKKFFYHDEVKDLNWSKWFFPVINTDKSLHKIDSYMQENLRYIVTGCHNKKNYVKVDYARLKKCNYRALVSEYYKSMELK